MNGGFFNREINERREKRRGILNRRKQSRLATRRLAREAAMVFQGGLSSRGRDGRTQGAGALAAHVFISARSPPLKLYGREGARWF